MSRVPLDLFLRTGIFLFFLGIRVTDQVLPGQATHGRAEVLYRLGRQVGRQRQYGIVLAWVVILVGQCSLEGLGGVGLVGGRAKVECIQFVFGGVGNAFEGSMPSIRLAYARMGVGLVPALASLA